LKEKETKQETTGGAKNAPANETWEQAVARKQAQRGIEQRNARLLIRKMFAPAAPKGGRK
jgi:hypothetical protein